MSTDPFHPLASGDTATLYRAAIGAQSQDYYLRQFLRFDDAGQAGTSWNWAAYWVTLNWLIYRKMWGWVLAYAGTLVAAAVLIFGLGKLVFGFSGLAALLSGLVLLTAAFVVPGLYGNAWFYKHCNDRISRALRETSGFTEAIGVLAIQAPTPRRLGMLVLANALAVGAVWIVSGWLSPSSTPLQESRDKPPALAQPAVPSAASAPAASAASAIAPGAAAPSALPQGQVSPPPQAVVPPAPAQSPVPPVVAPSTPPAQPRLPGVTAPATGSAPQTGSAPVLGSTQPAPAKPAAPRTANPAPQQAWQVQAGVYAQPENARRVLQRLRALGYPAGMNAVTLASGRAQRVYAGPFASQAEADQAAARIKAADLPAVVVRRR